MNYEEIQNRVDELTQKAIQSFRNHDLFGFLELQGKAEAARWELVAFMEETYVC